MAETGAMTATQAVPPRRRHEVSEPVEELKWRKLNDAANARPCGLPPASRADPVVRLVSGEHVADAGDATVFAADQGEPLQRERRPGTVSQQVLETLKIARHVAVDERDPDAGVNRKPRPPATGDATSYSITMNNNAGTGS